MAGRSREFLVGSNSNDAVRRSAKLLFHGAQSQEDLLPGSLPTVLSLHSANVTGEPILVDDARVVDTTIAPSVSVAKGSFIEVVFGVFIKTLHIGMLFVS